MAAQHATETPRKPRRRRALALAVLCIIALAGAASTMAFTTQRGRADNVVTFKNVSLRILQTEQTAAGEVPVDEGASVRADRGQISRIVRIENAGSADMFVRVRPVVVAKTADGQLTEGAAVAEHVDYTLNTGDAADQWTYNPADGWYYYNSIVTAEGEGSTTSELMSALEFMGDYYTLTGKGGSFEMTIDAQAVQSDHNGGEDGTSALEAVGWPEGAGE